MKYYILFISLLVFNKCDNTKNENDNQSKEIIDVDTLFRSYQISEVRHAGVQNINGKDFLTMFINGDYEKIVHGNYSLTTPLHYAILSTSYTELGNLDTALGVIPNIKSLKIKYSVNDGLFRISPFPIDTMNLFYRWAIFRNLRKRDNYITNNDYLFSVNDTINYFDETILPVKVDYFLTRTSKGVNFREFEYCFAKTVEFYPNWKDKYVYFLRYLFHTDSAKMQSFINNNYAKFNDDKSSLEFILHSAIQNKNIFSKDLISIVVKDLENYINLHHDYSIGIAYHYLNIANYQLAYYQYKLAFHDLRKFSRSETVDVVYYYMNCCLETKRYKECIDAFDDVAKNNFYFKHLPKNILRTGLYMKIKSFIFINDINSVLNYFTSNKEEMIQLTGENYTYNAVRYFYNECHNDTVGFFAYYNERLKK